MIIFKKEEFMLLIEGCRLPEMFDQNLLDNAYVQQMGYEHTNGREGAPF
jgi:hypothetical protein